MATYGRIKEYISDTHSMRIYLDEVEAYFKAKQKVMVLLSSIGSPTFMKLSDLMSRHSPLTKTYKQLTDALLKHCEPQRIEIAERYALYKRRQEAGETIAEYAAVKHRLASSALTSLKR